MPLSPKILWYFADPMCSWCWGFSPQLAALEKVYGNQLSIKPVVGGLRPYNTVPLSSEDRDQILHHWRDVQRMTGQAFTFEGALPQGFVYNTEPACRAIVTFCQQNEKAALDFFRRLHKAFYVDQRDITQDDVLTTLAEEQGWGQSEFLQQYGSDLMKQKTMDEFQKTRFFGVRGFPTLVLQQQTNYELLTAGYQSLDAIKPAIENWLNTTLAQ